MLTLLVLVPVLLLGTDLAFTAVVRAVRGGDNDLGLRVRDPVVHHALKPLVSGRERWGLWDATYHTNSLGLRDASARVLPRESDRPRLLFIGDSFTEGIGIDWPETFVGRVAAALGPEVEVLNAGAASYCPIIYERRVRQLLEQGLELDHVAVFVDIGDVLDEVNYKHDEDGNVVGRESRRIREERANQAYEGGIRALRPLELFLDEHTIAASALYGLVRKARSAGHRRGAAWTLDDRVFDEYGREGLDKARRHMDALHRLLQERGIGMTVAVYPWPDQILARDKDSRQVQAWREWSAQRGVGFVDYFPRFIDGRPAGEVVAEQFIPGDIHWNEKGHAVMAEGFLEYWRSRGPPGRGSAITRERAAAGDRNADPDRAASDRAAP